MKKIVVFCGSSVGFNPIYREAAVELGKYFVANDLTLIYGGGKIGMMGVLAETILSNGGNAIGVIPELLLKREIVNRNVTELIVTKTMSERKVVMSKHCDGYISLPGGFGTLDELFEGLTMSQLQIEQKPNGILNINNFFSPLLQQLDLMVKEGYLRQNSRDLVIEANSISTLMLKMESYEVQEKQHVINKVVKNDD